MSPNKSLLSVFAHNVLFSHVPHYATSGLVLAGKRPSRPTNGDVLGLSEDIWTPTENCWDRVPSIRPHIADILVLFEIVFRGWVSPTSEAITMLTLDRPTSQSTPTIESADTMSGAVFSTVGGGAMAPREVGQSTDF